VDMATEDDGESAYILTRIVNSSHVKEQRRIMNNVVLNIRTMVNMRSGVIGQNVLRIVEVA